MHSSKENQSINSSYFGVDVESATGSPIDVVQAEIFDVLSIKRNAIKLAAHAAITVLSVDQIIMSKPAGGPKMPKGGSMGGGAGDEED